MILKNKTRYKIDLRKLQECVLHLLKELSLPQAQLDITFVNDPTIRRLNKKFLNKDRPTDVLSFPLYEAHEARKIGKGFLGDVVISIPMALRQAKTRSVSLMEEILFLMIHATLHLLGYDHERSKREAQVMQRLERKLIKRVGRQK
jgi:probable rRNA maturation factor